MIYLEHDSLGRLDIDCVDGIVGVSLEIGWATPRVVDYPRALSDGSIDQTTYLGQRAVSLTLRFDQRVLPTQDLIDLITPYLSPRIRPIIVWTVQQNDPDPTHVRSLMIRGADAPLVIDAPKYLTMVLQWVSQDSYTSALEPSCVVSQATGTAEFGRVYDLDFDRDYPLSPPFGITYFYPVGNAPMDWTGTLTAVITDPEIYINGVTITFTGLSLTAGQTIIIDTRDRTILRNGDPTDSVYGLSNFNEWTWDDIRVTPGENQLRLQGATFDDDAAFTLCWTDRWYA